MEWAVEIIKKLIENKEGLNIRNIAKLIKLDYKAVYLIIKKLEKEKIIKLERFGKALKCSLNKKTHPLIFKAEFDRREKLLKNKNIEVLYKKLNFLPFCFIALIFGSYSKNKISKNSDIDLMIICEKNRQREIEQVISLLPLNIHLITLTYEEFLNMAKSREFSVVSEAMKNNIILVGIENYYNLIENVG